MDEILKAIEELKKQISAATTASKEELAGMQAKLTKLGEDLVAAQKAVEVAQKAAEESQKAAATATEKAVKLETEALREPDPVKHKGIMEAIASGHAPGRFTRSQDGGSYRLHNIWRAKMNNDMTLCKEEREISSQLEKIGFHTETGGILVPFYLPAIPDEHKALREELAQKMALDVDPGEVAWFLKQFPDLATQAFGLRRKDLELGDDSLGGQLVPVTQAPRIIDFLRARSVLVAAGAQEVPLPPTGNITYPRLLSDPTFTWTDPDSTSDASSTSVTFGPVRMFAKSLRGYITIPNDLIRYSTPAVELIVRSALGSKAAVAEDNQYLEGTGSSIAPKGLLTYDLSTAETPTLGYVTYHVAQTVGANGDTLEPEDPALIQGLYEEGLDPDGATAWIMRPMLYACLLNRRADAVSAGDKKGPFVFWTSRGDSAAGTSKTLQGVPAQVTTNLGKSDAKGTASTLHRLIYGNFRRMLIGRSGALELAASEHIKFLQDKTVVKCILRGDMGLEHEQSFVVTRNLLQA